MLDILVGRVPQQIATEEISGLDPRRFERPDQIGAR